MTVSRLMQVRGSEQWAEHLHRSQYTGDFMIDPAGYVLYASQRTNVAKILVSKLEKRKLGVGVSGRSAQIVPTHMAMALAWGYRGVMAHRYSIYLYRAL